MIDSATTYGYSESIEDIGSSEPITVSQVKAKLNISFSAHDNEIDRLIKVVRKGVEKFFSKSLITKTVSVLWLQFYDDITLPYAPIDGAITVTDLQGVSIPSNIFRVHGEGGSSPIFIGDFPNGVKLNYTTIGLVDDNINNCLIEAVGFCLEQDMTSDEAIKKAFRNARF